MSAGLSLTLTKMAVAPRLLLRLRTELAGARARAGIIGLKAEEQHSGGATNVQIAATHEFGATIHHPGGTPYMVGPKGAVFLPKGDPRAIGVNQPHDIVLPERSFLRTAAEQNRAKYAEILAKGLRAVIDGKTTRGSSSSRSP